MEGLRDDQWARIEPFVPGGRPGRRGPRSDNRRFVEALVWMARSGARWRDLPERFGPYQTVKRRYYRWIANGVLDDVFAVRPRALVGLGAVDQTPASMRSACPSASSWRPATGAT